MTRVIPFRIGLLVLTLTVLGAWASPAPVLAQLGPDPVYQEPVESLDFHRPESWALARTVALSLFTGMGEDPGRRLVERVEMGFALEAGWIPSLSVEERRVGFYGQKVEDMNKVPMIGRIRFGVSAFERFSLELGLVPPLLLGDLRPALVGGALGVRFPVEGVGRVSVRLHGQAGEMQAEVTCPSHVVAAGRDPERNPYGCKAPSRDRIYPRYVGLELGASRPVGEWRGDWYSHLALSVQHLRPRFQVGANWDEGIDRTILTTRGTTWSVTGGLTFQAVEELPLTLEGFYAPLTVQRRPDAERGREGVWNLRLILRSRIR